ncbi:sugar transferase [Mangrovicoccus sp. HB161399]|uniref:sugar transferase n=1 Tax=Mangrovicoccus sp. HB161399 TaxID=2720392 RepID=UPI0015551F29|nr:sugar transferase [Mangrovicoccus sp. HB161399]
MTASAKYPQVSEVAETRDAARRSVPLGRWPKRAFDIGFASLALAASALPFLIIMALLKIMSPGPVFFCQERVGFGGRRFKCLKFRTMVVDAEERLQKYLAENPEARAEYEVMRKLRDDPRIVPGIGRFLRKTSLDELPQFINVLRGDMSVVGPRPIMLDQIDVYGVHIRAYERTRPGITGLWQVSGRSNLSFEERVRLDAQYVESWSMGRDLAISARTLGVFFDSKNAC